MTQGMVVASAAWLLVGASVGCGGSGADADEPGAPDAADSSGADARAMRAGLLLEATFEGGDPLAAFATDQACCAHSITMSTAHARTGSTSFRAEVRGDDPAVSSGWRAELVPNDVADTGDRWYGWSMYFETPEQDGLWPGSYGGHFVQWHPDNGGGSASLSLWGSDGVWDVCTNPEGGGGCEHHAVGGAITAGAWHDVVFHVDWDGGVVQWWLDGDLLVDLAGVDYAAGPGQYFKFGMNRWGDDDDGSPTDDWVIFYDDLRIGDGGAGAGYDDVAP